MSAQKHSIKGKGRKWRPKHGLMAPRPGILFNWNEINPEKGDESRIFQNS